VAIVGGGIVGLAAAASLATNAQRSLIVLEAEDRLAAHQTGNNSGVIHSGLYYKPGSMKARTCVEGREAMYRFCQDHGIKHERCGKVVVAVDKSELPALQELERRGRANGLTGLEWLTPERLREYEPHVTGIAGLHVPQTGIADYKEVAQALANLVSRSGGTILTRSRVLRVSRTGNDLVLETPLGEVRCWNLINCGGLQADRLARLCGVEPGLKICPFRGEYYELTPARQFLVNNLIYPVPDPRFPFLGVHFTRKIQGGIEAGPNAVLALKREGYRWSQVSMRDTFELLTYGGFWHMAAKYWKTGFMECYRSLSRRAFVRALQRLVPDLRPGDIHPAGAGVRAQALEPSGKLVDDFRLVQAEHMIHVLNAPSPAATASLSIGRTIADLASKSFRLERGEAVLASVPVLNSQSSG
jgi:L-2-hydroxyglutarate oxidase